MKGLHDDYVMSLLFANQARLELGGYGVGAGGSGVAFYNSDDVY